MTITEKHAAAPVSSRSWERFALSRALAQLGHPPVRFELWDGYVIEPPDAAVAVATACIRSRAALRRLLGDVSLGFGDGYRDGEIEVDDLAAFLTEMFRRMPGPPRRRRFAFGTPHGIAAARGQIHHHYDVGNDFYALWLDRDMIYSGGYFPEPGLSLEAGQQAKLDRICRKLRLKPGEHVIDVGSGWGGLALYMARHYGVTVRGFNIAREQVAYARAAVAQAGLDQRIEFIEDDYRNLSGACDAIVSVGMLEHVGLDQYAAFAHALDRGLTPEGRGLIQVLGFHKPQQFDRWTEARIFPGAEPPALSELMQLFEHADFRVLDVENLGRHYAETLGHWRERFEQHAGRIEQMYDAAFVRMWRLYLAGSQAAFAAGSLQLYQVLFDRQRGPASARKRI